ncbi:serine O-acetyltransferase [Marinibactrum halimedae]|uniref:Serine acetyltransferase n=1 Tax=Marinibactrum halimedae TaxID=1444977 RepID=A0AA37T189_9GAMM|nr:serine O-acetyltransferase [Marinibactrum halimedae]MCD9458147.1 serine O-acetyltransferase [Marinibactrum halimedae]GLS25080.1 serine O-acetyltransferase [Marinibactrum halimedae]
MTDTTWETIHKATAIHAQEEPILASFLHATVLNHDTLEAALSFLLAHKLDSPTASALLIREVVQEAMAAEPQIGAAARADVHAVMERDSACDTLSIPFLFYKGYHALQAFRIASHLWHQGRKPLALFLQNRISVVLGVDIHPAATIGKGIFLDHATGIVIGETAVVDDDVSILQSVTLGGTGKVSGDRHPKIRRGVLIGAGAKILGNIEVGEGAQVGAGSVVLKPVKAHTVVAGVPAVEIGRATTDNPAHEMCHELKCRGK